jgi:hypothetical protein
VRAWLRQRRERAERIEDEAYELIRLLGDDAYAEARRREHTASSSATAREWNLIALAIARSTGRRIGLDLSTPMAMNAVFVPDREPDGRTPRPSAELHPADELKRVASAKSQLRSSRGEVAARGGNRTHDPLIKKKSGLPMCQPRRTFW